MDEQEINLRDYFEILRDRWRLVAATTAAALAAALIFSLAAPPVYSSLTTVVVDRTGSSFVPIPDITGMSHQTFVDTLTEIVRSRSVTEVAMDQLSVPAAGREQTLERLQRGLKVLRVRGSDVIRIQAEGPTPEAAAATANAVAQAFLTWHVDARRAQAAAGREFIEQQLGGMQPELRAAEDALTRYKTEGGQVSLTEQTTIAVTKLAEFEAQRRAAAVEGQAAETSLRQARAALARQAPTIPSTFITADDPVVTQLRQELTRLEVEMAGLRQQFTDRHPQVLATQARIEEVKGRLQRSAALRLASQTVSVNPIHQDLTAQIIRSEVERQALHARETALRAVVDGYARELRTLPAKETELARLTRDVKVAEQTYLLLSEKLQEARIAEASIVGDLRVVDRAVPPVAPVRPKTALNTVLGALLGLLGGVAGVFVLEALNTTFKTPEEAGEYVGLPVLAAVPRWKHTAKVAANGDLTLATHQHRRSPFAEAFRHLRTNLLYLSPDRPLRTILVTSPGPGEGKSTVAANLAVVLSQADRKTWLVECDLRRPHFALTFQSKTAFGLAELLVDGLPVEQAVHQTALGNLSVIPSGRTPPNPVELLGSRKMQAFLGEHDGREMVVLDAPPVLPVADAAVLAPAVDGVLLVVHLSKTHREAAKRAREQLESVGARVLGIVVNGLVPSRRGSSYGYDYSGYYGEDSSIPVPAGQNNPQQ